MDLSELSPAQIAELERMLAARLNEFKLHDYYPATGPLSRDGYVRHMEFFRLGKDFPMRGFIAANRVGKTEGGGGYETTLHLTGLYPDWWEGYRFDKPIRAWVAGDTNETVRDIIQLKLLGPNNEWGTGLIPKDHLGKPQLRQNSNGAVDRIAIKHFTNGEFDGWSDLGFKSYEQKRKSFQGTERDLVWLDEESDEGIRAECVMRLMTTQGLLIETFTPLKGITPNVKKYIPNGVVPVGGVSKTNDRALVMAGWDHAPHLSEADKRRMLDECEPHLIDARSKGIPALGEGAVFPIDSKRIVVAPFKVPAHWPRIIGIDFGYDHPTAAICCAWDRDNDVFYLVAEYREAKATPLIAASSVKRWGTWVPVSWPHDGHASGGKFDAKDQLQLYQIYKNHGLKMLPQHAQFRDGSNGVEAGIMEMLDAMKTGGFKVFANCVAWIEEFQLYHRENGMIVKEQDDAISASRYAWMMRRFARVRPVEDNDDFSSNGIGDARAGY